MTGSGAVPGGCRAVFGTPQYIIAQTLAVVVWITLNSVAVVGDWDPYPFILLNLAFSTAYAAPLILLAQTRQVVSGRGGRRAPTEKVA